MFSALYAKVLMWSRHKHAEWYLGGLSFAESSFFPIPPDVLLAPMALAQRAKAFRFALLTTVTSVLGGVFGYLIGYFFIDLIIPWLENSHYFDKYQQAREWFDEWGFAAIFIAGFSPIPYKIFTITAGALSMSFIPFVLASFIGRGSRFFLVSTLIYWGGERLEETLHTHINRIGWATTGLIIGALLIYRM